MDAKIQWKGELILNFRQQQPKTLPDAFCVRLSKPWDAFIVSRFSSRANPYYKTCLSKGIHFTSDVKVAYVSFCTPQTRYSSASA
ncbi:hypothetical protein PspLS_07979 [Pyricularia sp. CBS 133598]|nr:hypothetical protein PspLS_07979 [Pyricularia sp. CBS 133598]